MPQVSRRSLLPLGFVLAVVAAACAEPVAVEVDMGSGVRFVPAVADPLSDAGRYASVAVGANGLPVVAYFGFQEELEEGEIAAPRPIGTPSLPSVMLATVSEDGYWTRGAIAMAGSIANVTVPFNPVFEESVADLTPRNVTGLSLVAEGDTYHAAWASVAGVYYATGSLDPASASQATATLVSSAPGLGLSLAVDGSGRPWIAFYTSTSSAGSVSVATPDGDRWQVDAIAEGGGCATCRTAVVADGDGMAVAYGERTGGVAIARNDGENGWVSVEVARDGGAGLSGTATADGFALAFYGSGQVTLATGSTGSFASAPIAEVAEGSADLDGARTALAVGDGGEVAVSWVDAAAGVGLATGPADGLQVVATGSPTEGGSFPAVAIAAEPANTYLGWYDTGPQDALVGAYGDVGDLPIAQPSPTSTEPIAPPVAPPTHECTPVEGGRVTVIASGVAFTEGSCIEAPVGEAFTIDFDNQDDAAAVGQHNIQIYQGPEASGDLHFEGELVSGPQQVEYQVPAFEAVGEYAFICVVHPSMTGSVQVVDGGGDGGGGGGDGGGSDGGSTTVSAANLAFDTSTIELTAGEQAELTFVNDDAGVQHNIAIYEDDTLAVELFNGELITGPDEITYEVPALDAGTYYFLCIVHPTMNGSVVVT